IRDKLVTGVQTCALPILAAYPGAEIALREFENGPPIDAPIALRIEGTSLDTLHAIAARVERVLKATPGTQYVTNPVRVARTDLRSEERRVGNERGCRRTA